MKRQVTNVAASVHGRLLHIARNEGRPFQELLQYYAMERLLARLSASPQAKRFVLKGALMLRLWAGSQTRATKDIDLLGMQSMSIEDLVETIRVCFATYNEEDGLIFDLSSVKGQPIRLDAKYDGVRILCVAFLGKARVALQLDVGFGDIITPRAQAVVYPTLLDFSAPTLLGYTPETAIAEKLHAMVLLDEANSRLKDFYDVWLLSQTRPFDGELLSQAVGATFERRATPLPSEVPFALAGDFHTVVHKDSQWRAFLRKARLESTEISLERVTSSCANFLVPILTALQDNAGFDKHWSPGGPWQSPSSVT